MDKVEQCLPSGYVLAGREHDYIIESCLGQGSFGITYLAKTRIVLVGNMGRGRGWMQVAVKEFFMRDLNSRDESTLSLQNTADDGLIAKYRRAFLREANNLSQMQHPNIVNVIEVVEANNTAYIVMEYVEGGDLSKKINEKKRKNLDEAKKLVKENPNCTQFITTRFGNVLGSNGSVIPYFKKQIAAGGPVTVTHRDIIRYFMTIPEASQLVLASGAMANNGELFVLDMGKPVKILEMAENMIRLAGFEPYKDIDIQEIGLRPGEKLYEEKLLAEEGLKRTENRLIHIAHPIAIDEPKFDDALSKLHDCMADDRCDIRKIVKDIVPTYHYTSAFDGNFELA